MKLQQLFEKDIHRDINGVIKVGQLSEHDVRQELEEYVLTRELRGYFSRFYGRFVDSMDAPSDKIGVWISGFFGSGKSHFLKILAYLLENRRVDGDTALGIFGPKVSDAMLLASMQRAGEAPKDVILFNIDSKADASSKSDKEAIVKVFMKVFDEHVGYFGSAPEIAEFERTLEKRGQYQAFQAAFERHAGTPWLEGRDQWGFLEDEIVASLVEVLAMSEESARNFFGRLDDSYSLSVEKFAGIVNDYLASKSPEHRVVFMVDEVGQYVGEDTELMLNLQTVAEDLGVYCGGRAWIVVTSQEDIDAITQNRVKGNDFSKIQGRFATRLSLSSANTDEVIKLRLLDKTDAADQELRPLYTDKEQVLRNLIRFGSNTAEMPTYRSADDFVQSYPFVPYQFTLLQKVFTQIRLHGASGKHLAQGERSMLDAFQIAAKRLAEEPVGRLVPFHHFYQAVEGFLDASVKLVISQAGDNARLEPGDVELLKTLFMIKYVKEIKGTPENLTTLELDTIDQDRLALKQQIEEALTRLERETLIQRSGDVYEFLTNEEQDIGREIKNFTINPGEVENELQKMVWQEIFPDRKYRFGRRHDYGFNQMLDEQAHGNQTSDLTLHVVTPEGDAYDELREDASALLRSGSGRSVIVRLPDDPAPFAELRQFVKTNRYLTRKTGNVSSPSVRSILQSRSDENRERRKRILDALENLITRADVFVSGSKLPSGGSKAKEVLTAGLTRLVENTFTKLQYVQSPFDSDEQIEQVLRNPEQAQTIEGEPPNARAHSDMHHWLDEQINHHQTVTLRVLEEHFSSAPYGWTKRDVEGVLAELLAMGKAELKHNRAAVDLREAGLVRKMTSRQGLDTYTVRVPPIVNPESLRLARELAREALDLPTVPTDAQQLFERYRSALDTKLGSVERNLAKAQQGNNHPFREQLEQHQQLLRRLLSESSAAEFFDALREHDTEFKDLTDASGAIEGFYRNQVEHFDRAQAQLQALAPELQHLNDDTMKANVEQARAILRMDDPTRDIPRLSELLASVETHIERLREQARSDALQAWKAAKSEATSLAAGNNVPDDELAQLLQPLVSLESEIPSAGSIDAAIARQAGVEAAKERAVQAVIAWINDRDREDGKKPIKQMRPAALATSILESEQDIEQYVEQVKDALLRAFKSGHRLRIE